MPRRALSATRAADVLNFLAAHPEASFSYSQIAQRLGINLASTHNLLIALTECGYLTRDPEDRRFALGPALVAIGDAALRSHRAIEETRRAMRELSRDQDSETLAFVRAGSDALCVARAGPSSGPGPRIERDRRGVGTVRRSGGGDARGTPWRRLSHGRGHRHEAGFRDQAGLSFFTSTLERRPLS